MEVASIITRLNVSCIIVLILTNSYVLTNNNHKHFTKKIYEEMPKGDVVVNIGELADKWFGKDDSFVNKNNLNDPIINSKRKPYKFKFLNCEKVCAMFRIESDTGVVSVARRLDRDNLCHISKDCCMHRSGIDSCSLDLTISPYDDYSHVIVLVLDVQDINDNSPYWFQGQLSLTFSEASNVGEGQSLEVARDNDSGKYGVRSYKMDSETETFALEYKIDESMDGSSNSMSVGRVGMQHLKLILKIKLDREKKDSYEFRLTAFDGGIPSKNGSVRVIVTVSDENDNNPEFEKTHYTATVNENLHVHTPIVQVKAIDKDSGMNGKIEYRMSSMTKPEFANLFNVESNNGFIRVRQELNFELYSYVILIVEASDLGSLPRSSSCTVSITIKDLNDNEPVIYFEPPLVTGEQIIENDESHKAFSMFSVQDKDSGKNGDVSCYLEPRDNKEFNMSKIGLKLVVMYKIMTIKSFDREKNPRIQANIICWDNGTPRKSVRASAAVNVQDVNDEAPRFSRSFYRFQIEENARTGSYLFSVNATDYDEGVNALIKFSIFGEDAEKFSINTDNGRIYLDKELDREKKSKLHFSVRAEDCGIPKQVSFVNVSVQLLDCNDNVPFLQESINLFVFENHSLGVPITILNATDKDIGLNGQIVMQVQSEVARTTLHQQLSSQSLMDSSSSAPVYRNVFKSKRESNFVILSGGKLMLREQGLDREKVSRHELSIVIRDRGTPILTSTSTVIISVRDNNDCSPTFVFPNRINNTVNVVTGSVTGTIITQIQTIDLDEGLNGKVTYSFKSNHYTNRLFSMNPNTGKITLQQTLTETDINNFILIIVARDSGTPYKEETTSLNIKVKPKSMLNNNEIGDTGSMDFPDYYGMGGLKDENGNYDYSDNWRKNKNNRNKNGRKDNKKAFDGNIVFIMIFVFIGILFVVFISIATAILIYKRVSYHGANSNTESMNNHRNNHREGHPIKSNFRNWKRKFSKPFVKKQFHTEVNEDFQVPDSLPGQSLMHYNIINSSNTNSNNHNIGNDGNNSTFINNCDDTNGLSRSFFLNPISIDSISQFYGDNKHGIESTSTFHGIGHISKLSNEYSPPPSYLTGFPHSRNFINPTDESPGPSSTNENQFTKIHQLNFNNHNSKNNAIKKNNYNNQNFYQPYHVNHTNQNNNSLFLNQTCSNTFGNSSSSASATTNNHIDNNNTLNNVKFHENNTNI